MRRVFFSFDWNDIWQANQVRNSWVTKKSYKVAGYADAAEIEKVKRQSDRDIKAWIDRQMKRTSVTCVLIGSETDKSKWVRYEIEQSINRGNGLLGIYTHGIKDSKGKPGQKGKNLLDCRAKETNIEQRTTKGLLAGGTVFVISKLVLPQFTIPLTIAGAVLAFLPSDESYATYDWLEDDGYENLGYWIEKAAKQAKQ